MYAVFFLSFCLLFSSIVKSSSNCTGTHTLLTFDDSPTTTSATSISNGYFGLNWINVYYDYVYSRPSGSGYYTALSSGSYNIVNGYGNPMTISSTSNGLFNISSFIAAAAWNDNLLLSISGQRNGTTIYQQMITLEVTTPSVVILSWTHIDTISFTTSGGTVNSMFAGTYSGNEFAMDNLCADISSFYTTTRQPPANSTASPGSGNGGNGNGGGGGGEAEGGGVEIPGISIGAAFGSDTGMTLGVGELTTAAFGGIIGAVVAVLIILAVALWCLISSRCCSQSPNCNGCGGGGC